MPEQVPLHSACKVALLGCGVAGEDLGRTGLRKEVRRDGGQLKSLACKIPIPLALQAKDLCLILTATGGYMR